MPKLMITFDEIHKHREYIDSYTEISEDWDLHHGIHEKPFPISQVLKDYGLETAYVCFAMKEGIQNLQRKYLVHCALLAAREVSPLLYERQLTVAWLHSEGLATNQELVNAQVAAARIHKRLMKRDVRMDISATKLLMIGKLADTATNPELSLFRMFRVFESFGILPSATIHKKLLDILDAGEWVFDTIR